MNLLLPKSLSDAPYMQPKTTFLGPFVLDGVSIFLVSYGFVLLYLGLSLEYEGLDATIKLPSSY